MKKKKEKHIYLGFKVTISTFYRKQAIIKSYKRGIGRGVGRGGGSSFWFSQYFRRFNIYLGREIEMPPFPFVCKVVQCAFLEMRTEPLWSRSLSKSDQMQQVLHFCSNYDHPTSSLPHYRRLGYQMKLLPSEKVEIIFTAIQKSRPDNHYYCWCVDMRKNKSNGR